MEAQEIKKQQERKEKQESQAGESLIRILDRDIKGNKRVAIGLMRIRGISWGVSNGICKTLKIDSKKKIADLTKEEIRILEEFIKKPKLPAFLLNRRKDIDTGSDLHLTSNDLDLRKEFDIKLLKKIRSYRGLRHALGLPTRGQKTRSHFRENKKSRVTVGVGGKKPPAGGK